MLTHRPHVLQDVGHLRHPDETKGCVGEIGAGAVAGGESAVHIWEGPNGESLVDGFRAFFDMGLAKMSMIPSLAMSSCACMITANCSSLMGAACEQLSVFTCIGTAPGTVLGGAIQDELEAAVEPAAR